MDTKDIGIALSGIIGNGNLIKQGIKFIPPPVGVWRTYKIYEFEDYQFFETWKNCALRLLSTEFKGDRCIKDFEDVIKEMKNTKYPSDMDKLLGILIACEEIPKIEKDQNPQEDNNIPLITINNTQNQTQSQEIVINIFIEAIKDELSGKQLKEIKDIIKEEGNSNQGKTIVIEKLKSFGEDILSNIVANIITNPIVWGHF